MTYIPGGECDKMSDSAATADKDIIEYVKDDLDACIRIWSAAGGTNGIPGLQNFLQSRTFRTAFPILQGARRVVSAAFTCKNQLVRFSRRCLHPKRIFRNPRLKKQVSLGMEAVLRILLLVHLPRRGRKVSLSSAPRNRALAKIMNMADVLLHGWPRPERSVPSAGHCFAPEVVVFALYNSLPHDHAGYALRSHTILRHLQMQGIRVSACTRPGYPQDLNKHAAVPPTDEDTVDGIVYRRLRGGEARLGMPDRLYVEAYGKILAQEAQKHSAGIVHAASNYLNGLAAVQAAAHIGGKAVYEMRGLWHLTRLVREPWLEGTCQHAYFRRCELDAADQADAVVCISAALKSKVVKGGIPEHKITVIPNAVNVSLFTPRPPDEALRRKLGLEGRKVIAFIGSLTAYEGIELLMQATQHLNAQGEKVSLLIVGDGPHAEALRAAHRNLGSPKHCLFTGRVPFAEVSSYYSIADILPFPRLDLAVCRYVPPLKILEAMCMEKNVLASALPPLQEMIAHGETGLLFKANNVDSLTESIAMLLNNRETAARLRRNAREWVIKERNWSVLARKYKEIYQNL